MSGEAAAPRRAMALFAASAAGWVLLEDVLGSLLQQPYPLLQVVWCRYAAHLLVLGLVVLALRSPARPWRTRRPGYQLARSLLMLLMPLAFMGSLVSGGGIAATWAVFWVMPLLAMALAWRCYPSERPARSAHLWWAATGCTLAAALLLWPWQSPALGLWPLAALATALSCAAYYVMTRSLRTEPVEVNLFYTAFGVFALLTPLMPFIWMTPSLHDALVMFGIGTVGLASLYALDRAAAAAPLVPALPGLYLNLPLAALLAHALHGTAGLRRGLATVVILLALVYLWRQLPAARARAVAAST